MRALHLNLDDALAPQAAFQAAARQYAMAEVEARDLAPSLRLWTRPRAFASLRSRLRRVMADEGPWLTFTGSGDFHHISLMLISRASANAGNGLTVVHFDNHPDWVRFGRGVHCGSWVQRAVRLPQVQRHITVGVCSQDVDRPRNTNLEPIERGRLEIYPYRRRDGSDTLELGGHAWPTIGSMGEAAFLGHLLSRIGTRDVYITIDKDVLRPADAATNWDQGELSLSGLEALVQGIAAGHRIVGADVMGDWSPPRYAGVIDGCLKRAEALIDQPQGARLRAAQINEPVNERLLHLFGRLAS